jgi:hypothetical protein
VKYLWSLSGVAYALLSIFVGYLFITSAAGARLTQRGLLLEAAPFVGGLALIVLAPPLVWNCLRLASGRQWRS